MAKYTDEQIKAELKRALEIGDAPIGMHWGCSLNKQLVSDTLDLINRQEAEIERLKEASEETVQCFHRMESLYNIKCMELKVAKSEADRYKRYYFNHDYYKLISEAIKEFAERLKEKAAKYPYYQYGLIDAVSVEKIDSLIKEMAGENAEYDSAKTPRSS